MRHIDQRFTPVWKQTMRAVAYCRKSTSGTDESGVERQEGSFARQKASIDDYARRKGIEIVRWYEEPVSGKSIRKRKVFLQMVQDARSQSRPFKAIIFGEYDRFMRDVKEAMRYEVDLDDSGVELHFTNLQNDGSVGDQIYKSVAREMAAEYSRELARKVVQGMVRKATMGSWLGGMPPYGYIREKDSNGNNRLIVNEVEAEVVREIFKMSAKGHGHKYIAMGLNEKGIPTGLAARTRTSLLNRNPDGLWGGSTVRMILRNPVYKGVLRWNKKARVDCFDWRLQGKGTIDIGKLRTQLSSFKKNGSLYSDRDKPAGEWIVKADAAPAIVPAEIFDAVQSRFGAARRVWRRPNTVKYFMAGALRCSCGNGFSGHRYGKLLKATGERAYYEYYRCVGDIRKGSHGKRGVASPMLRREAIDSVVRRGISEQIERLMDSRRITALFKERIDQYLNGRSNRLSVAEDELAKIEKEMDRLSEIYVKFERPIPEEKIYDLNARKKVLSSERDTLIAAGEKKVVFNANEEVAHFLSKIKTARRLLDATNPRDRMTVRDVFLDRAEVRWDAGGGKPRVDFMWRDVPEVYLIGHKSPPPVIIYKIKLETGGCPDFLRA